jgi:hypothetical protein
MNTVRDVRAVAQLGRAPGSGPGGRRFESCQPDCDVEVGYSTTHGTCEKSQVLFLWNTWVGWAQSGQDRVLSQSGGTDIPACASIACTDRNVRATKIQTETLPRIAKRQQVAVRPGGRIGEPCPVRGRVSVRSGFTRPRTGFDTPRPTPTPPPRCSRPAGRRSLRRSSGCRRPPSTPAPSRRRGGSPFPS